jgi:hypothetical protein
VTLSSPCEEVIICHLPTFSHWKQHLLWSLLLYIFERLQLLLGYKFLNKRIFLGNNNQTLVIMWKFHPFKGSWVKCSTNQRYTHTYTLFGHFSKRHFYPPTISFYCSFMWCFQCSPKHDQNWVTYNPHETNWVEKEKGLWKGIISALHSSLSTHKSVFFQICEISGKDCNAKVDWSSLG